MSPNFTLPEDMKFGEAQIIAITAYSIMFTIGFVLNTISLYQLLNERLMRRNIIRYVLLSYCMAMRSVSFRVKKRFPDLQHLVDTGLMREDELEVSH